MVKQVNVRTDKDHWEALDAMQEDGCADSYAEAMRQTSRANCAKRGYLNGGSNQTKLRRTLETGGYAFFLIGLAWVGFTFFYPVTLRMFALAPIFSGAFCLVLNKVLEEYEPAVSKRLKRMVGGAA